MRGARPRILGLSLLAAVGVMAVSASAAQGKWLLLNNKTSVLLQTFNASINSIEFLVPSIGFNIYCIGATGTDHTQLNGSHVSQTGGVEVTFFECEDLNFGEVCAVRGEGDPIGKISAGTSGTASMSGEKVLINAETSNFATIEYLGEECPLTEINGGVSGSLTAEIANPLEDAATHTVTIVAQNLECGGEPVEYHAAGGGPVTGTITTPNGATYASHLVAL